MNPDPSIEFLRRAAEHARTRPAFLGWVLACFERVEALSAEGLRERLRVSTEDWPRLQLCLRPRPDQFLADVTQIAGEFGLDRTALAAVIRRVEAVEVAREQRQPVETGSLLAARSRKRKPPRVGPGDPSDG